MGKYVSQYSMFMQRPKKNKNCDTYTGYSSSNARNSDNSIYPLNTRYT